MPERVAVALALDNNNGRLWSEAPQAVEQGLGAPPPGKSVVPGFRLRQGSAEADGWLGAAQVPIGNAEGRRTLVRDVRQSEFLQEGLRQPLVLRIGGERVPGLLQCCR